MKLLDYRNRWQEKAVLREIYKDYYSRISDNLISENILEIGGGSGNFKEIVPDALSTDIQYTPWLDMVADAQELPNRNNSFNNIVMVDVLHHLDSPIDFFHEAQRILKTGGKLIMLEPAITPFSWFFYNFIHEEPVLFLSNPLEYNRITKGKNPFDANQAIPILLFSRYKKKFLLKFPNLRINIIQYLSLFAYPLSGGFKALKFLTKSWIKPLLMLENRLSPIIGKFIGFRVMIVLEKILFLL